MQIPRIIIICLISTVLCHGQQPYPDKFSKITNGVMGLPAGTINPGASFGIESAAIGDLNDDGVVDLAVGATNEDGSLVGALFILFMNSDGTVKSTSKLTCSEPADERDSFGSSVAALGDLDDDGVEDIGVGAGYDGDNGYHAGAYWILFMNKDGTTKARQKISALSGNFTAGIISNNVFGTGSTGIGDLDGDGNIEIAVGARSPGMVFILFLNNDGTVKNWVKIDNAQLPIDSNGLVGYRVVGLGDVDLDGIPDIAIGGHRSDLAYNDSGVVYVVFLKSSGNVKTYTTISTGYGNFTDTAYIFGVGIAGIGDFDGDAIRDMVVGGNDVDASGTGGGAIWYLMLNANGTVKSSYKISQAALNSDLYLHSFDYFGCSISFLGDIDHNGKTDIAVGAMFDDDVLPDGGTMWISVPSNCTLRSFAGDDKQLCGSHNVQMNATFSAGSTGTWSIYQGSGSFSSNNDSAAIVSNPGVGENVFIWTVSKLGCSPVADTVKIIVVDASAPPDAGSDKDVCSIQTVKMTATLKMGETGQWSIYQGTGNISSTVDPGAVVTQPGIGENIFIWTVFKPECDSNKDTVKISVDPVVRPNAGPDQLLCAPISFSTITGNSPHNMIASWSSTGPGKIANASSPTTDVYNLPPGINQFVWTFQGNDYCPTMRDTVLIAIQNPLTAKIAMQDTTYTCLKSYPISAEKTNGIGQWEATGATIANPDSLKTEIDFSTLQPTELIWRVHGVGCQTVEDKVVIIPFDFDPERIPNVITPNSDGKNDRWRLENINRVSNDVRLYNRWGEPVFSASNYKNDWGGGNLAPGVYFYLVAIDECKIRFKGWLSIIH
jgi:gliding motility-associated-like protein